MGAVAGTIGEIVTFGLDDRYFDTYADKVRAQTPASVTSAAARTVLPDHLVWVIVGDRARIESALRELDLGEIHLVDADGNPRADLLTRPAGSQADASTGTLHPPARSTYLDTES